MNMELVTVNLLFCRKCSSSNIIAHHKVELASRDQLIRRFMYSEIKREQILEVRLHSCCKVFITQQPILVSTVVPSCGRIPAPCSPVCICLKKNSGLCEINWCGEHPTVNCRNTSQRLLLLGLIIGLLPSNRAMSVHFYSSMLRYVQLSFLKVDYRQQIGFTLPSF